MNNRFLYHYRRARSLLQRGLRSLRVRGLKASLAMLSPRLKQPRSNSELYFPGASEIADLSHADFACDYPEVSVIIPVHNHLDLTQSCLASLLLHRSDNSCEVIVVDDASDDASHAFLSGIKGLHLIRMAEQSGYVLACNRGASEARGKMLVFLNNDTVVQDGWLEALLDLFDRFPDTGIAGAKLLYPNGVLQEAGGAIFNDGSVWNTGRFEQADNPRFNYVREVDYVSGATMAIRKNDFEQMKGFDTHFSPGYFEDTDLAMRVRARGLKIRYTPFSNVVHQEGATSGTDLETGMKAFQTPHQIKFYERWQSTLASYPLRPKSGDENRSLAFRTNGKKILVLDEHTPRTDADSGSLRLFHLMKSLQDENCDLHFLPADLHFDAVHTRQLQQHGIACHYRPWTKSVFGWLKQNAMQFDIIIVCRVSLMSTVYDTLRTAATAAKLIFDTVDLHYIREMQEAGLSNSETMKKQARATREKEHALILKCDETWVVSDTERKLLEAEFPNRKIRRISNIHPVRLATPRFEERKDVLFVGNFRHPPNRDGLQWFLEKVWPIIHDKRPDIAFNVIGATPPEPLTRMAEKTNVVFHGYVHDIEKHLDVARINIAPLRYGAGAKGKISQALCSGLPTVATSIAADGMHLTDRQSVSLADDADAFANTVLGIYDDETSWNGISKNGYAIAVAFFSEHAVAEEIRRMLLQMEKK